jgi:anti-sigma regulatory factor (Ser/Thr protein kinase)
MTDRLHERDEGPSGGQSAARRSGTVPSRRSASRAAAGGDGDRRHRAVDTACEVAVEPRAGFCVLRCATRPSEDALAGIERELSRCFDSGAEALVVDLEGAAAPADELLELLKAAVARFAAKGGELVAATESEAVRSALLAAGLVEPAVPGPELDDDGRLTLPLSPNWRHQFSLSASVDQLSMARRRVVRLAQIAGLSGSRRFELAVAVGEALANAVEHGSPHKEIDTVRVRFFSYDDEVAVEVSDAGGGLSAAPICAPDPMAQSGRGIHFMRALTDGLLVTCGAGGTKVLLVKRRG